MCNKCIKIIIPLFGFLHLISGSHLQLSRPRPITVAHRPVKFSAQIPVASNRRQTILRESNESLPPNYDYSGGFPDGFAQGLPSFDFNGPIPGGSGGSRSPPPHNLKKDQTFAAAINENSGFVHGPPKGFPNLEALGADFPSFDGSSGENQRYHSHSPYSGFRQPEDSAALSEETNERDVEFGTAGKRYSAVPVDSGYRGGSAFMDSSPHPSHQQRDSVSNHQRPYHHQRQSTSYSPANRLNSLDSPNHSGTGGAGSERYDSPRNGLNAHHHINHSPSSPFSSAKRPIVLKEEGYSGFVEGPPSFDTPNPDRFHRFRRSPDTSRDAAVPIPVHPGRKADKTLEVTQQASQTKLGRGDSGTKKELKGEAEDLKADGSEQEAFWELSSPFILFDRYKKEEESPSLSHSATQNLTFLDTDGGEQRFFPSFPASSPYLGNIGNPFGSGPSGRPPLFPGPATNRAPSRYHPQFGPKYTSPTPNRGPSNVYSAESHDRYQDTNLLGSGNFEVVRGGTYYGDDDDGYHGGSYHHPHDDDDGYYHHNGHSSPQGYRAPGGDFFSNFRDFADINPPSRSFSHNHETLTEPRQLSSASNRQPKNILDKLQSSSDPVPVRHTLSRENDPMVATF